MQVSTLAWSDYIGRIGCGRVLAGGLKVGDELQRITTRHLEIGDPEAGWEMTGTEPARVTHLWVTRGLENREVEEVSAGDIVWLAGPDDITIGDTLASPELEAADAALPPLEIEEPTVSMFFLVNNGPFAGQDGRAATLRQIKDRLERELRVNVALRVEDLGRPDGVKVSGRGELHLAILIEEMRREGLELCVSRPEVITHRDSHGKLLEPMEQLIIDVPEEYQGAVIQELSLRKGELVGVQTTGTGLVRLEFTIPTRGLIGYRNDFLTETRGLGVMSSRFTGYGPWRGELPGRDARLAGQPDRRRGRRLLAREPAEARRAVRRQHDPGLRGHDRRRELARPTTCSATRRSASSSATTARPPRRSTPASRCRAPSPSRARWSGSPTTNSSR